MTNQPTAPQQADKATLATRVVRAHIYVAIRDNVADDPSTVTLPDNGGPITVTAYGRTIQITTRDITDQTDGGPGRLEWGLRVDLTDPGSVVAFTREEAQRRAEADRAVEVVFRRVGEWETAD